MNKWLNRRTVNFLAALLAVLFAVNGGLMSQWGISPG